MKKGQRDLTAELHFSVGCLMIGESESEGIIIMPNREGGAVKAPFFALEFHRVEKVLRYQRLRKIKGGKGHTNSEM